VLLIEENMMKSVSSNRSIAAWKPLALASTLTTLAFPVIAQAVADQTLAPVTVSASRFENNPSFAPIGATVITAAQIRDAGIGNVNEAIRKIGGVYGRQNLNGTSDYSLDLRGFGETSNQNMVVMVDGIRISENEQANALMSSISIESVERIEIVRGGNTVMYGEGATGGTIQIITKRGFTGATRGSIFAEVGNRNSKEVRASLAKGWDGFSIDANISGLHTDNYRDNNKLGQDNFSGGMQWASATGRVGMRVDASRQDSGLPGGISYSQFLQNPKQADTPFDYGSIDSNRYTLFAEQRFGNWELAADLSHREKTSSSFYAPSVGESVADGRATQFSPRIRHVVQSGTTRNELVAGLDFSDSDRSVVYAGSSDVNVNSQQSQAIYVRDEIQLDKLRLAAGARHEKFDQDFNSAFSSYDQSFSLNAWDLQGRYDLTPLVSVFAKAGRSYRVANVDDNGFTLNNALLSPQTSDDLEVGASYGDENGKLTAKLFRQKLKNEIFYDAIVPNPGSWNGMGANVNLDPTKHEGVEIEGNVRLTQTFALSAILQHVDATFMGGPYAGREMTLIPKNTATLRLNWMPGNGQTADVGVQWADTQRYGGDVTNICSTRIPAFATLDAHYAVRVGAWEFGVTGANLTDKSYFSQAFGTCQNSATIYPDAGRSVKVSARMDF
jgi:iron complex outermembrane receptor protein